jgi:hypothetical protein
MALSRFGGRRSRRPHLRIRSHTLDSRPRHRVVWQFQGQVIMAEVWTDAEWQDLTEPERPDAAIQVPGLGIWMLLRSPEEGEG